MPNHHLTRRVVYDCGKPWSLVMLGLVKVGGRIITKDVVYDERMFPKIPALVTFVDGALLCCAVASQVALDVGNYAIREANSKLGQLLEMAKADIGCKHELGNRMILITLSRAEMSWSRSQNPLALS